MGILVLFFATIALAADAAEPFWKAKEKVYKRIQNGDIVVSVTTVKPEPPFKRKLSINGGGQVRAGRDFVFNYAQDFAQVARLSGFIEKSYYDSSAQTLRLSVAAMGHRAELKLQVKAQAEAEPKRVEFTVVEGPLKGMRNTISFTPLSAGKTEVGIEGFYSYDEFPIPKFFLEFGMEVVFQKIATRLRQQAEAAARATVMK
ncbi:MAG: SRPBCC family protein [Bdellovibrionales bacterium]|nr:SRPBCC family protein [Bdellovibrionales bacterium]